MSADELAEQALAGRLMAATGLDGYSATEVVRDVNARHADSPHAELVGQLASDIIGEFMKPFNDALQTIAERLLPGFAAFGKAMTQMAEQVLAAAELIGQWHDQDRAAHPIRHRLRCQGCRLQMARRFRLARR